MLHKPFASLNPFASCVRHHVLVALLLVHAIALRTLPNLDTDGHSSGLPSKRADADFPVLCGFNPYKKEKRYYFDLPSADPDKPEDDRAVVLYRDPQAPKLVVYNHAHWRISQKTRNAKLVGHPQWTPVDSSDKVGQQRIDIYLHTETDLVRRSIQNGVVKFELKQTSCSGPSVSDDREVKKEERPSNSSSSFLGALDGLCGLSFAGGTFYPAKTVQKVMKKVGTVWKSKEQVSMKSSETLDVNVKVEPSSKIKNRKLRVRQALLGGLMVIPSYSFFGVTPVGFGAGLSLAAMVDVYHNALVAKNLNKMRKNNSAAAQLFEKIYCLSGVCAGERTCMAKCRDEQNDYVVMPRSRVVYATNFTCD